MESVYPLYIPFLPPFLGKPPEDNRGFFVEKKKGDNQKEGT
jgi:hypothetical protein